MFAPAPAPFRAAAADGQPLHDRSPQSHWREYSSARAPPAGAWQQPGPPVRSQFPITGEAVHQASHINLVSQGRTPLVATVKVEECEVDGSVITDRSHVHRRGTPYWIESSSGRNKAKISNQVSWGSHGYVGLVVSTTYGAKDFRLPVAVAQTDLLRCKIKINDQKKAVVGVIIAPPIDGNLHGEWRIIKTTRHRNEARLGAYEQDLYLNGAPVVARIVTKPQLREDDCYEADVYLITTQHIVPHWMFDHNYLAMGVLRAEKDDAIASSRITYDRFPGPAGPTGTHPPQFPNAPQSVATREYEQIRAARNDLGGELQADPNPHTAPIAAGFVDVPKADVPAEVSCCFAGATATHAEDAVHGVLQLGAAVVEQQHKQPVAIGCWPSNEVAAGKPVDYGVLSIKDGRIDCETNSVADALLNSASSPLVSVDIMKNRHNLVVNRIPVKTALCKYTGKPSDADVRLPAMFVTEHSNVYGTNPNIFPKDFDGAKFSQKLSLLVAHAAKTGLNPKNASAETQERARAWLTGA